MKKFNYVFAIVITQLLLFAGCKNMLSTELQDVFTTVDVRFSANVDKGRTVMPETIKSQDLTSISLFGNIDDNEEKLIKSWETYSDFEKDKITLEKNTWNFRLTAAYAKRECFEAKTTINLNQTNTVEFKLNTVTDGVGDIHLSLFFTNPEDTITEYEYYILPIKDAVKESDNQLHMDYEAFEEAYFGENGNPSQEILKKNRIVKFHTENPEEKVEKINILEKDLQSNVYYLSLWVYGFDFDENNFLFAYDTIIVVTPGHVSSAEIELGNVLAEEEPKEYGVTFIDMPFYYSEGDKLPAEELKTVSDMKSIPLCDSFVYYDKNNDLQLWDMERDVVNSDITLYPAYKYSRIEEVLKNITTTPIFKLYFYDLEPYYIEKEDGFYSNQNAINEIQTTARSVKLDLSLVRMGWEDIGEDYKNYVITIPENFCKGCEWLEEITLPMQKDALYTHVEKDAFYGCSNLKSIYFCGGRYGDDIAYPLWERYGENYSAFGTSESSEEGKTIYVSYYEGCTSLENIYWKGDVASYLTAFQFSNYPSMEYYCESPFVSSNAEKKNIYFWENNSWELAKKVEVTNSQASGMYHYFGAHAFEYCTSIEQISLRDCSEQSFPTGIFANCPNLTTATIESCTIGPREFINCTSLDNVELTDCIVQENAFVGCAALQKLEVAGSALESNAFNGCTSLTDVTFLMSSMIEESAFNGCNDLSQVRIKNDFSGTDCILYNDGIFTGSADDIEDFMGLENIFNCEPKCQIKKLSLEKFPHKDIELNFDSENGDLSTDFYADTYKWYVNSELKTSETSNSYRVNSYNEITVGKWTTYTLVVKDADGNYSSQCIQISKDESGNFIQSDKIYGNFFDGIVTDGELSLKLYNAKSKVTGTENPIIQKFSSFKEFEIQEVYVNLSNYELLKGSTKYEFKLESSNPEYYISYTFTPDTTENTLYFTPLYDLQEQLCLDISNLFNNINVGKVSIDINYYTGFNDEASNNDRGYELVINKTEGGSSSVKNYTYIGDTRNYIEDVTGIWNDYSILWDGNPENNLFNSNQYLMTVTVYDLGGSSVLGYFQSVLYFSVGGNTITIPEINLN